MVVLAGFGDGWVWVSWFCGFEGEELMGMKDEYFLKKGLAVIREFVLLLKGLV